MSFEIGGFAHHDNDIDGNEYDRKCYNVGVAENYLEAFYLEDKEAIGNIDIDFLNEIAYYHNLYEDREKDAQDLISGKLKTIKNRTFIEAIIDNKWTDYVPLYIDKYDEDRELSEKLALCFILNAGEDDIGWLALNNALSHCITRKDKVRDEYISRISNIIINLEKEYIKEGSIEEKKKILLQTKQFLSELHWPEYIGKININDVDSNDFLKGKVLVIKK